MTDFRTHPVDPESRERLAAQSLRLEVLDTVDSGDDAVARFDAWLEADFRGFHAERPSAAALSAHREGLAYRRTTGVYDESRAAVDPVATVSSWVGELSVPGGRVAPAWAISSVTVAPTHKRRGIARALLEAELRTASALGVPIAMLTVSESVLYGRYGFAPAALATDWVVDVRRARPLAGVPTGWAIEFVSLEDAAAELGALHDRERAGRPGEIDVWPLRWWTVAALAPDQESDAKKLRAVVARDANGAVGGVALYKLSGGEDDFTKHTLAVVHLLGSPDAEAALWGYLLEVDLVGELTASLRSVDEPLRWMLNDFRAARVTSTDHLWLRVLDVPAALAARSYAAPGALALEVDDPLGFAAGTWLLKSDADGAGRVTLVDAPPAGTPALALSANELAALYLGGASAVVLARAGRVREATPGAAAAADALLRSAVTPHLSVWF